MNNHQKLQLIRHLERAERCYMEQRKKASAEEVQKILPELDDCRDILKQVRVMSTTDSALALNIRDEAMAPAHPGRA